MRVKSLQRKRSFLRVPRARAALFPSGVRNLRYVRGARGLYKSARVVIGRAQNCARVTPLNPTLPRSPPPPRQLLLPILRFHQAEAKLRFFLFEMYLMCV